MIIVEVNQVQLQQVLARLAHIRNGANRALSRALNKTANKAKTLASREIRSQVRLTAAYVRDNLQSPANSMGNRATVARVQARISTPKRGIRLDRFLTSATPTRAGKPASPIKVKVKPTGGATTMPSAFFVRARNSGGYLIALPNDIIRQQGLKTKLSLTGTYTALHGPSLSQVFDEVRDRLPDLDGVLAANLEHEMEWLLEQYPPPAGDGSGEE